MKVEIDDKIYSILYKKYQDHKKVEEAINIIVLGTLLGELVPKKTIEMLKKEFEKKYLKIKREIELLKLYLGEALDILN